MSTYFASPDYDRYLDAQMEAHYADTDAYNEWCDETGRNPEEDHTDAWEEFKQGVYEAELELDLAREMDERMEMGDEWYE